MWPLETSRRERRYPTVTVSTVSYTRGIGDIILISRAAVVFKNQERKSPYHYEVLQVPMSLPPLPRGIR